MNSNTSNQTFDQIIDHTNDVTIDEIIEQMNDVIDRCIREKSKLGYFAVLYRDVTVQVRSKIQEGNYFEDNARMEYLDVVFANRYLDAIHEYWNGGKPSKSWLVAFEATKSSSPMILQHLLLGMNAHINLDLGIATAQFAPSNLLPAIKKDFQKIMDLLSGMIEEVEERIEKVSPSFRWIDKVGGKTDEKIAGFVINKARDLAWETAEKLAVQSPEQVKKNTKENDEIVALVAKGIKNPGFILSICFWFIKRREEKNVVKVINALQMD